MQDQQLIIQEANKKYYGISIYEICDLHSHKFDALRFLQDNVTTKNLSAVLSVNKNKDITFSYSTALYGESPKNLGYMAEIERNKLKISLDSQAIKSKQLTGEEIRHNLKSSIFDTTSDVSACEIKGTLQPDNHAILDIVKAALKKDIEFSLITIFNSNKLFLSHEKMQAQIRANDYTLLGELMNAKYLVQADQWLKKLSRLKDVETYFITRTFLLSKGKTEEVEAFENFIVNKLTKDYVVRKKPILLNDCLFEVLYRKITNYFEANSLTPDELANLITIPPLDFPPRTIIDGEIRFGHILVDNTPLYPVGFRLDELPRHISVNSFTGGGKTTFMEREMTELCKLGIKWAAIAKKTDLRKLKRIYPEIKVIRLQNDGLPFFGPLIPPRINGKLLVKPGAWLEWVAEIICSSYLLGEGGYYLMITLGNILYEELDVYDKGTYAPTIKHMLKELEKYKEQHKNYREQNWIVSFEKALKIMTFKKEIFNANNFQFTQIFHYSKWLIIETDSLNSQNRGFVDQLMLLYLKTIYSQQDYQDGDSKLKFVYFLDEAHNYLRPNPYGNRDIIDECFQEFRSMGISTVVMSQSISTLRDSVQSNAYSRIALNLSSAQEREYVKNNFGLTDDQTNFLNECKPGEAIIKLQGRYTKPFKALIEPLDLSNVKNFTNKEINEMMEKDLEEMGMLKIIKDQKVDDIKIETTNHERPPKPISIKKKAEELSIDAVMLLKFIYEKPHQDTTYYYGLNGSKKLGPYRGDKAKANLLGLKLIKEIKINTGKARAKKLELTKEGEKIAIELKKESNRFGSGKHKWLIKRFEDCLNSQGHEAHSEYTIGNSDAVDLYVKSMNAVVEVSVSGDEAANYLKIIMSQSINPDKIYFACNDKDVIKKVKNQFKRLRICDDRVVIANWYEIFYDHLKLKKPEKE